MEDIDFNLDLDLDLDLELELDLYLNESLCTEYKTNLVDHFNDNEIKHCDLFEIQLYINLSEGLLQENTELLNQEIERMVAELAA